MLEPLFYFGDMVNLLLLDVKSGSFYLVESYDQIGYGTVIGMETAGYGKLDMNY